MTRKSIHVTVGMASLIVMAITFWLVSDLRKDTATTFGTIGFFVTAYGVIFTIIEVIRTGAVAQQAAAEAKKATDAVKALYGIQNLSECLSCIQFALDNIEKDEFVSLSALAHITKLYTAEFYTEYIVETSTCRQNVAVVQSYASLHSRKAPASTGRLKDALLSMIADLSVSGSTKIGGRA